MKIRKRGHLLAFLLVLAAITLVSSANASTTRQSTSGRRRGGAGVSRTVSLGSDGQNEELCSIVIPTPDNSSCTGGACSLNAPVTQSSLTISSNKATGSSDDQLEGILGKMDDGIRQLNSERKGGENIFLLGMTGAGKSTMALLLTNISSMYSCKRYAYDQRFIIRDMREKISTIDSQSKTKVPEIVHSPELGGTVYDCPGFADTNFTDELTSAYFIKHALDTSRKVKFLIVAPFHTLQTGGNRHYLSNLLLHVVRTVKNIEKYADSFALAVTFGNSFYPANHTIHSVVGFLQGYLDNELQRKFHGQEDMLNSTRVLLESLLYQDENGTYVAIGVFRSPTQHGRLNDIQSARDDREQFLRMLTQDTIYQTADPQDFGYSVSEGGKLRAVDLVSKIDEIISQNMHNFWEGIQQHYETVMHGLADPIEDKDTIDETLGVFTRLGQFFRDRQGGNNTRTERPKGFVVHLMSTMALLRLDLLQKAILDSILLQDGHVTFLENLMGTPWKPQSTRWFQGLEPIAKFLEMYKNWANALVQLEQTLATYEVQNASYCFSEFRNESGSIDVTAAAVQAFKSSKPVPQASYAAIKNILTAFASGANNNGSTTVNFRQLNPILEYFVGDCGSVKCTTDGATAKITGNFILASKLRANSCITASTKKLVIYAWVTFFLDATLIAKSITGEDSFDLVIIANQLKSFGQKIDLTGKDAKSHRVLAAAEGKDGSHGADGERGGNFFGLFGEKHGIFCVELNGGKGGDGQNGGKGLNGRNGFFVEPAHLSTVGLVNNWQSGFFSYIDACKIVSLPPSLQYDVSYPGRCEARFPLTQSRYVLTFYGNPARPGLTGGNGGNSGIGGKPGMGRIYQISEKNVTSSITGGLCGSAGTPGQGGIGGLGGQSRNVSTCLYLFTPESKTPTCTNCRLECKFNATEYSSVYTAPQGDRGQPGISLKSCVPDPSFNPHDYTYFLGEYKKIAKAQLISPPAKRRLLPFLMNLERNKEIDGEFYTPISLLTDLVALEELLPSVLKLTDSKWNFFYSSILNRIAEMMANRPSQQEESALREAASVAFGRLAMLNKKTMRSNLITDLEGYIDHTNQILQELKTLETSSIAASQITATVQKFTQFIQSRINEVDDIVEKVIQPEIEKIEQELEKKMETMLKQLIEERTTAVKWRNDLYTEQFGVTAMLRKIFGMLKTGARALGILGKKGAYAGAAVYTVSSVVESLASDDAIPPSLLVNEQTKALTWYHQLAKQKLLDEEERLRDVKAMYEKGIADSTSMWTENFHERRQNIELALVKVGNLSEGVKQMNALDILRGGYELIESLVNIATSIRADVGAQLRAVQESLTGQATNVAHPIVEGGKFLLSHVQKLLAVVNTEIEIYKVFRHNGDSKFDELARAEKVLKGYDAKIDIVDSRMPQILNKLDQISTAAVKSARNQSSGASLDLSTWKFQSTLDDLSSEIQIQILSGVPIDSQVIAAMGKLKEAFRTLFTVCNRMQDYVTEQRMATFISDSLLSTVQAVPVGWNPELYRNLQKLKLISQSNLVLNYWENIEHSFRMYVFPYADLYLNQFPNSVNDQDVLLLPKNLTDLPGLVTEISRRSSELKRKLVSFRTTIVPELHSNQHEGDFSLRSPFYTWSSEQLKHVLVPLLAGHPVNLFADVSRTPQHFDAVKFKTIHLQLICLNSTVNASLQTALGSFEVNMTQNGVNNYRFDSRFYRIFSQPLSLKVSFEHGRDGPSRKNDNYIKLTKGNPLLSPYTLWTFQIYKTLPGVTFDQLKMFENEELSLVLTGSGTYVSNSAGKSSERQVNRFYKAVQV